MAASFAVLNVHVQCVFVHACLLVLGKVFAYAYRVYMKSVECGHVVAKFLLSEQCVGELGSCSVSTLP